MEESPGKGVRVSMAGADWGWRGGEGREEGWGRELDQAGERWHGAKAREGWGWGYNTPELPKGRVRLSCGDTWGVGACVWLPPVLFLCPVQSPEEVCMVVMGVEQASETL